MRSLHAAHERGAAYRDADYRLALNNIGMCFPGEGMQLVEDNFSFSTDYGTGGELGWSRRPVVAHPPVAACAPGTFGPPHSLPMPV